MTTKVLTIRVPTTLYSNLCTDAAELGTSVSSHVRHLIAQEHDAEQLAQLRRELLAKLDGLASMQSTKTSAALTEVLLLSRVTAAHLNPQLVAQVRAKLAGQQQGGTL